jgi:hypothetical protein
MLFPSCRRVVAALAFFSFLVLWLPARAVARTSAVRIQIQIGWLLCMGGSVLLPPPFIGLFPLK